MVLGIVLIVLGVLFILLSLVAAARLVLLKSTEPAPAGLGAFDPEKWQKFIEAVTNFVKVAPQWLLLSLVGAGLIAWGATLV